MRAIPLLPLTSIVLFGCGARTEIWGDAEARKDDGSANYACNEGGDADAERVACEGSGLVSTVAEECLDDGGSAGGNDLLEIYCVSGIARFCLSNEACPWRLGESVSDEMTCSPSGLSSTYMANTRGGCSGFQGHSFYCCSPEGRISFAGH